MSAQLIGFPYDPFILFAIPTSCSYRPQTPTPAGSYPSPPLEWLQTIVEEVWLTLQSHPAYATVWGLHEDLYNQASQAEAKLLDTLHDIQTIYEGGPPPL